MKHACILVSYFTLWFYFSFSGRREKQISQLWRGLKDTGVLRMIKERPSLAAVLFPRSSALVLEPEVFSTFILLLILAVNELGW